MANRIQELCFLAQLEGREITEWVAEMIRRAYPLSDEVMFQTTNGDWAGRFGSIYDDMGRDRVVADMYGTYLINGPG